VGAMWEWLRKGRSSCLLEALSLSQKRQTKGEQVPAALSRSLAETQASGCCNAVTATVQVADACKIMVRQNKLYEREANTTRRKRTHESLMQEDGVSFKRDMYIFG